VSENIQTPKADEVLWEALKEPDYRHGFAQGHVGDFLANQIHTLRIDRDLSQKELAKCARVTQPQISNWETSCDGINLTSLSKLAEALDVALIAKFVPFSELARELFFARSSINVVPFEGDSIEAIRKSNISISMPEFGNKRSVGRNRSSAAKSSSTYLKRASQTQGAPNTSVSSS
jgi:transcriptional regulator with XRE-family HTH domain